jgi:hypothetical protein
MALCACGCGGETRIARRTTTRRGIVKGGSLRFIHGHNARVPETEYRRKVAANGRQRPLHILRAEKALGKSLPLGAVVHHADGSRREDAPLVICQDRYYHQLLHIRMRVKAAGGNPNADLRCGRCRQTKPFAAFTRAKGRRLGLNTQCKECDAACHQKRKTQRERTT